MGTASSRARSVRASVGRSVGRSSLSSPPPPSSSSSSSPSALGFVEGDAADHLVDGHALDPAGADGGGMLLSWFRAEPRGRLMSGSSTYPRLVVTAREDLSAPRNPSRGTFPRWLCDWYRGPAPGELSGKTWPRLVRAETCHRLIGTSCQAGLVVGSFVGTLMRPQAIRAATDS
jgi:hypothetical protein